MTSTGVLRVLFVGDDGSSPEIAAGLLRNVAGDRVVVDTASTQPADPGGRRDEMLVAMGLNPADSHRLSARAMHTADLVVVLGAGLDVARMHGTRYEEWDLAHDDLIDRVQTLISRLDPITADARRPGPRGRRTPMGLVCRAEPRVRGRWQRSAGPRKRLAARSRIATEPAGTARAERSGDRTA